MLKKLFLIIVSLVIAFELIAIGWMINSCLESKHGSKVHSELVGKGMTPEEYKEWNNKVVHDLVRANAMGEQ